MRALLLSSIACCLLLAKAALAESGGVGSPPMYVVDMQRVMDESIAGKAARNNIKAEVQKREAKLLLSRNELAKMEADLEKQEGLLSEDALKDKRLALMKKGRDFEREVQDQREEIDRQNGEAIGKIVRDAQDILAKIAADDNLPFVLERGEGFVVYAKEEYDLTQRVIKSLDSKTLG
jgi:outer membrane protein